MEIFPKQATDIWNGKKISSNLHLGKQEMIFFGIFRNQWFIISFVNLLWPKLQPRNTFIIPYNSKLDFPEQKNINNAV